MQHLRCLWGGLFIVAIIFGGAAHGAEPASEIVVAMRYLQEKGTSHSHLYLYREDGKLLRQLTKDDGGQDRKPVFAPDGEAIVFTRELPGGGKQWWSVEPRGNHLRRLEAAPDWYVQAKDAPCFTAASEAAPATAGTAAPVSTSDSEMGNGPRAFPTDGTTEVLLTPTPEAGKDPVDEWNVALRELASGRETRLTGKVPGWFPSLLVAETNVKPPVLNEGPWRVVFVYTSLGSSDGGTVHAVGLSKQGFVRLARNWATPFPLPGEAAFLSNASERYVPFGNGGHTANCSYLDLWNADLKRTRYARADAAALCYGASVYRPGKTPAVITIRGETD